ncbi:MAG TPA: M28 family peptidase [Longimicrobiales bacterium]|nr:M28 family peptidase [Longimicrobiales bacterium]
MAADALEEGDMRLNADQGSGRRAATRADVPARLRSGAGRIAALALLAGLGAACAEGGADEGRVGSGGGIPAEERAAPDFRADTAFALLERQVSFGPRVPGTAGHAAQLEWMIAYLRVRADTVVLQPFTHTGPEGERLEMTNVFARFQPERPDRVLLLAHWDTRPTADSEPTPERRAMPIPGANDGASGTAVLLELANVLSSHSPPIGVDLLFVDGEDYAPDHMYLGATHFARTRPPAYEPFYGILVDMVADRTPLFPQEGYSRRYAPEVVDRVWRMAERLGYGHLFPATPGMPIKDDHVPLNEEGGIRTINIIDFDYGPGNAYWHTLDDTIENVGPEGLEAVGTVLAELIYRGG